MYKLYRKFKSRCLWVIGCIKVFPMPMWIVFDPSLYKLDGIKVRKAIDTLKPGDIVARRYVHYLDGFFIPGKYSHTGIYVGDNTIIHAVAAGVCKCDILDFLQADGCAIIRYDGTSGTDRDVRIAKAIASAHSYIGTKYDYFFSEGDDALYCHEFVASCYPNCGLRKMKATALFGLMRKKDPVYLAQSFTTSSAFETVIEL